MDLRDIKSIEFNRHRIDIYVIIKSLIICFNGILVRSDDLLSGAERVGCSSSSRRVRKRCIVSRSVAFAADTKPWKSH